MKAMILAAGQGKRLRPLTERIPKPMVEAGGQSLIAWHIEKLKAIGITYLVVNGAWLKDVLFEYLGDGSRFGVSIELSPEDSEGLETAGGIIKALPLLGSEPFIVVNGDIFLDSSYDFLLPCPKQLTDRDEHGRLQALAHLYLTSNPAHNTGGDFAVSADGHMIYGSDYTFSGFAWYHPEAFAGRSVSRQALRPYFDDWAGRGLITASVITSPWFDVGTVERLQQLNAHLSGR